MIDFIYTLLAFIVAISILVAVHEFGHFWVAKKMGVKVLRYSIGFGRPLWKKSYGPDQTEYVVAALPLGGYVKMLDEREGEVLDTEKHRAFNNQTVSKRIAIVAAGPIFNFIFAALAYWLMLSIGVNGLKPVIGDIDNNSVLATAGFNPGDEIVEINDRSTPIWDVAIQELVIAALNKESATVAVSKGDGFLIKKTIDFQSLDDYDEPEQALKALGLKPWRPHVDAVVGKVLNDSPASSSGLIGGDKIVAVDGQTINDWYGLVEYVSSRPEQKIVFTIIRNNAKQSISITPTLIERGNKKIGQIGIGPAGNAVIPEDMKREYQYPYLSGLTHSLEKVWRNSVLTLKMIGKLITGEVSIKNLSGPINIAVYAGYSASAGLARFLDFLAIVSISLGVINLLPIPLLDGGHLMNYLIEIIKGKPVSENFEMLGQRIGIVIIVMMMALAIGNDLTRIFGG
ncbi:MAG: RIP metalloprotease RseP [Gammaproteobacteria bacterium]|nr:RIP metalloprotease RseP [Gammaproteobacteria bacterium]